MEAPSVHRWPGMWLVAMPTLPPTADNEPGGTFQVNWTWDGAGWTRHPWVFQEFDLTPPQAVGGSGVAAGARPFTYEWQRNGVRTSEAFPYQGTTNATLALDRVLACDAGTQPNARGKVMSLRPQIGAPVLFRIRIRQSVCGRFGSVLRAV